MTAQCIIEYFTYLWPIRKTKAGLGIISIPFFLLWIYYASPKFFANLHEFVIYSSVIISLWLLCFVVWLFNSGRIIRPGQPFTVIFCLKSSNPKSTQYIENSIKILKHELDRLGLLHKIKIKQIGSDVINNKKQAISFRSNFDVGLIIWGEIFYGGKSEKQVCDFKTLRFIYKVPSNLNDEKIQKLFKNDVNIALIDRNWNIYEINSLPDTEKISENLSEIILFISGLIYGHYFDYAEDSGTIMESLLNLLEIKTKNDKLIVDDIEKPTKFQLSANMFRKGRLLTLILDLYKQLGVFFVNEQENYAKGILYLEKCMKYGRKDIDILASAALASFHLKDFNNAHLYTDQMNQIEKNHPIYIFNHAFFGIYKKNYSSALFFYKEIIKRDNKVQIEIITKVIAFLDERKSENPKEIAYDFAIGILNMFHCQKKEGEKELRRFMRTAKNKEIYKEMVSFIESENLLKKKKRRK